MRSAHAQSSTRILPSRTQRAVALLLFLAIVASFAGKIGFAADSGKTITLGESLNDAQRQELLDFFGASSDDRVETVTVADTIAAMEGITDEGISTAFSSTALVCRELGEGLEVSTRNITVITPSLYAIALVTAGIGDAELSVAAPDDAPAKGLTALTGVFKTWELAPCDSGNTSDKRQKLALEEITLAVEIGEAFGTPEGVQVAGDIVLFTQQAVVINGLKDAGEISDAIAEQEASRGVQVPAELRDKLVDFMVKLAKQKIDWSTFAAGWEIQPTDDGTGITMVGDGIAIRNAQETATVRAAENQTATAEADAAAASTATAEALANDAEAAAAATQTAAAEFEMMTATAQAELDANAAATEQAKLDADAAAAQATQDAISAGLTATASVPTPQPTATPAPVAISGTFDQVRGGQVWIKDSASGDLMSFTVPIDAAITRGGERAQLSDLKSGDEVSLTIDGYSNTVRALTATAPSVSAFSKFGKFLFLLPALAVIPLILFLKGRSGGGGGGIGEAFVVKRVASA